MWFVTVVQSWEGGRIVVTYSVCGFVSVVICLCSVVLCLKVFLQQLLNQKKTL